MSLELECPYNELELKVCAIGLDKKITPEIVEKMNAFPERDQSTKAIAEYHSVSTTDLINSPNYQELVHAYQTMSVKELLANIQSIGFNEKEAWVLLLSATGQI